MSRLEEVEAEIDAVDWANSWEGEPRSLRNLARTLAAEVDDLRGRISQLTHGMDAERKANSKLLANIEQLKEWNSETLAENNRLDAEVDDLRGKLDDVRQNIGCARGQRTTQYCAEAAQRDEVISTLLNMLKLGDWMWDDATGKTLFARACEIAGRAE